MRLLYLVEDDDAVRAPPHCLCELATSRVVKADVTGWRADKPGDTVLLGILAHIQPDEGLLVRVVLSSKDLAQLRLSNTSGSSKVQRGNGAAHAGQPCPSTPDCSRKCIHSLMLADDTLRNGLLQVQQPPGLILRESRHWYARPLGEHARNVSCRHQRLVGVCHARDRFAAQLHEASSFVEEVYGLVGQEALREVTVRQPRCHAEGLGRNEHAVVFLIRPAQSLQDLHRLRDGGLLTNYLLEAPLKRRILLDVLHVLVRRGGANDLELAASERRLQEVRCVHRRVAGKAGTHKLVDLVYEEADALLGIGRLLYDGLQALLELATVLRAGNEETEVQRINTLPAQPGGHTALDYPLRKALGNGSLPDARGPYEARVVFPAPEKDLDDALQLGLAPDDRVEEAILGHLRQISRYLVKCQLLVPTTGPYSCKLPLVPRRRRPWLPQLCLHCGSQLGAVDPQAAEHAGRAAARKLRPAHGKQQLLTADVRVLRLRVGRVEEPLRVLAEGQGA
mmetsp:Transcript_29801/g.82064  ORF Transcript_29801/g.82064 Transcript_29801/m.82064 type:complete len:508 (+) Transcript_29801:826-2349(+)